MLRLIAHAQARAKVIDWLDAQSRPLIRHLIRYFTFPTSQDHNHWRDELGEKFVNSVPRLKGKNKPLPADKIYQVLWEDVEDEFNGLYIGELDTHRKLEVSTRSRDEIKQLCADYLRWLADILPTTDYVLSQTICRKLESLDRNQS